MSDPEEKPPERPDRLGELLARCDRDELQTLRAFVEDLHDSKPEWAGLSESDLRVDIARELGYRGSSDVAYFFRFVTKGEGGAGIPYGEILDDLMGHLAIHPSVVRRVGMELGDHLVAKEMLVTLAYAYAVSRKENGELPADAKAAAVFTAGIQVIRTTGAYPLIVNAATKAAKAVAGRGVSMALNGLLARAAGFLLGPANLALTTYSAARAVWSYQAPDLRVCAAVVAILGSLRLKYFPPTEEQMSRIETYFASLKKECVACGKALTSKDTACLLCWTGLHGSCGTDVRRLDSAEKGKVCSACLGQDLRGEGLLVPSSGLLSPNDILFSAGYRLRVLDNRIQQSAETVEMALAQTAQEAHKLRQDTGREIQQLRKDLVVDLERMLRKGFGYLWTMLFSTIFLTMVGIGYYQATKTQPDMKFQPGTFFRFGLVLMVVLPTAIWFLGALMRAVRNRKREDYEKTPDGRRLLLKDYLFGFLYYENPIENVWGPITLIGIIMAALLFMVMG